MQIETYDEKKDYVYLFYYDSDMKEINDTAHDNVERAMKQAMLEFNVSEQDWENVETIKK